MKIAAVNMKDILEKKGVKKMNKVILTGNLAADPEIRYTKNEIPVAHFRLAVNRIVKKGEPKQADFVNCVAWNGLAKICGEYLKKGRLVAVEGKLQFRSYENKGQKKSVTEIILDNMQMLDFRFFKATKAAQEMVEVG